MNDLRAGGSPQHPIEFELGWAKVNQDGILKLQNILATGMSKSALSFTNQEYASLYTIIYEMCIQKGHYCHTERLYRKYDESFVDYLHGVVLPAILRTTGEYQVKEMVNRWEDHQIMKKWMFDFFKYLDRFYVKRHNQRPLKEVALNNFRTIVFDSVKVSLTNGLIQLIRKDRQGDEIDRDLLRKAIQIYVEMGSSNVHVQSQNQTSLHSLNKTGQTAGSTSVTSTSSLRVYKIDFEKAFLAATGEFYSREVATWLSEDSCPEYLRKVEARFNAEKKRLMEYLHSSTEVELMKMLQQILLLRHQKEIIEKENTGVKVMLETHDLENLSRLFKLYQSTPAALEPIAKILLAHIVEVGDQLLNKYNNDQNTATASSAAPQSSYIDELISLHEKYFDTIVKECFAGHATFQKALKEAFELVINKPTANASTAELLSTYADNALRKGGLNLTEKQLQATLDNIVRLFAYLTDKDVFAEFYRKALATRLLTQRSASDDAEKIMIGKLKLRCGAQFTSKFEGMINDMRTATEYAKDFKDFLTTRDVNVHGIDFSVQTLTTGFWPSYPMDEIKLPSEMNACVDAFRVYYDSKTNNRRLRWIHELGVVTLGGNFKKNRLDLVVTTLQAAILMLFNDVTADEGITIQDIISFTGLTPEVVKQQLKSMVSAKCKILVKVPENGYDVSHRMKVNLGFVSAQRRVRVPNAIRKVGEKERAGAQQAVSEDRKHAMEATIVRIMKSRKRLTHRELIADVSTHLMQFFTPEPRAIKQRIEDLITREYLERDKEDSNVYHYLA